MGLLDSLRKVGSVGKKAMNPISSVRSGLNSQSQDKTFDNFMGMDYGSLPQVGSSSRRWESPVAQSPGASPAAITGQPVDLSGFPLSHPALPIAPPVGGLRAAAQAASYAPMDDSFGNSFSGSQGGAMGISRDTGGTDMGDATNYNGQFARGASLDNAEKEDWRTRQSLLTYQRRNNSLGEKYA